VLQPLCDRRDVYTDCTLVNISADIERTNRDTDTDTDTDTSTDTSTDVSMLDACNCSRLRNRWDPLTWTATATATATAAAATAAATAGWWMSTSAVEECARRYANGERGDDFYWKGT